MARPKTMNAAFGEFISAVMERFNGKLKDPRWLPSESEANVLKRLGETQVILQKGKPLDEDGAKLPTIQERNGALEMLEAAPPPGAFAPEAEKDVP